MRGSPVADNQKVQCGAKVHGRWVLAALGWASGVAQAVLLRESMALAGGSELSWGVVLAVWLVGMSAGARLGVRVGRPALGAWGPPLVLLASLGGVVLLRAAPLLAGATPGEVLAAGRAAWLWAAAVLPVAVVGGWCFPLLAAVLGGAGAAGRAWALEAAGALLGGVAFTFALARVGSLTALAVALAVVVLVAPGRRAPWATAAGLALATGLALPWADAGLARLAWGWAGHPGELVAWANTRQQRLELGSGPPLAVYGDGALIATPPDPYLSEPFGHFLALLHPAPRTVLCVGCLGAGVLPALLAHPLERVILMEDDPELARRLPGWLGEGVGAAIADPRVEVRSEDPVRAVVAGEEVDLVLLLDGDPTTLRRHRTRSLEFLGTCAQRLAPGGRVVVRTGVSDTYLAGAGGELLSTLAATLAAALPQVVAWPGEEVLLVAGRQGADLPVSAEELAQRSRARGETVAAFDLALVGDPLDEHRRQALAEFLRSTQGSPSTAAHPRAVLLAALHAEGRAGLRWAPTMVRVSRAPGWPALVLVAIWAGLLLVWSRRRGVPAAPLAGCVGFCSMGWWVLLLAAWQGTEGSVYAEVGVLSGLFMAGVAAGAWRAGRGSGPLRWLAGALGAGTGVSLAIASGLPLVWPRAVIVPLMLAAGACTGCAFPGVATLAGRGDERRGAGRGFSADEAGAAVGALCVGLVAFPWLGLRGSGMTLAGVMAAALLAVLVRRRCKV